MCTAKVVIATVLATEVIGESPFIIEPLDDVGFLSIYHPTVGTYGTVGTVGTPISP